MRNETEAMVKSGFHRGMKTLATAKAIAECKSELTVAVACNHHCYDRLLRLVIEQLKGDLKLDMMTRILTRHDGTKIRFFVGEPDIKLRGLGPYERFDD